MSASGQNGATGIGLTSAEKLEEIYETTVFRNR